jgi:teichoic acid transport system ATP-binding protein
LKFAIASSVVHDILLLDEALATGDMDFKERSIARMHELRSRAQAVVLVSHSMSAIRESCTRVVWLDKGTVRGDGPAEDVIAGYVDDTRRRRQARRSARAKDAGT